MTALFWIISSSLAMIAIALVGSVTLLLKKETLDRILLPLVAFAAGSLIGGAFIHMIPAGLAEQAADMPFFLWILTGFTVFFLLEQFMHWHHCHRAGADRKEPLTYLILIGDGLHNFIGGLAIAGTFLIDIRLGMMTWLAAAAHEVPQELGDFGVLIHGGWSSGRALAFNVISASTFLLGGLITYTASFQHDLGFLVPFAAGNFIYIGASDLIPEVTKHSSTGRNLIHCGAFVAGVSLMALLGLVPGI